MTSAAATAYQIAVLTLYAGLPGSPGRPSAHDRTVARSYFERGVPLDLVESALLLATLRRQFRREGALPLSPVRSLAYFSPVVDELLQSPLPQSYHDYIRAKARHFLPADVQKTTVPRDR